MPAWLQRDWCSPFVLSLGHFVWQGTLIAVVLAIALRATKTVSVRYWLSLASLLVMAACPMVALGWLMQPVSSGSGLQNSKLADQEFSPLQQPAPPILNFEDLPPASRDVGHVSNVPVIPSVPPVELNTDRSGRSPNLQPATDDRSWWQKFAPHLTTAYLSGVVLMLLRLVFGLWGGRRLRRRVHLIDDPSLLAAMRRQAAALGLKLLPILAYCERVTVPTVVGVLKPMILLPLTLTSGLSPEQMESVLAHELAHLRRSDHLVNLLQRVIESLLFFHPAVWWVSHRIRDEREHCCDDMVVACGAIPLDYAKSLLVVAELSRASPLRRSVAAVSLLATGNQKPSNLRQRIARLLGESATPSLRVSPRALLLAIGIPLVALIVTIQSGAGRGSPDPALDPTADLPKSDEETMTIKTNNTNGDLQSNPAEESGDTRRVQAAQAQLERAQLELQISAQLKMVTELAFTDTPLADSLTFLSDYHNIPVELDASARKFADSPVTLTMNCADLAEAVTLVLGPFPLSYCIDEGRLLVATPEEIQRRGHKPARTLAEDLAELKKADATIPWETLLRSEPIEDVVTAAKTIVPKLNALLDHRNDNVQRLAARCSHRFGELAPLGPQVTPDRPALEKLTKSKNPRVARAAWMALISIGQENFSTLPLLLAELEANEAFGESFFQLLPQFGPPVWKELGKAFLDSSPRVRANIARCAPYHQAESLPVALLAVADTDIGVRRTVLRSYRPHERSEEWLAALQARLTDTDNEIRVMAAGQLLSSGHSVNEAVELLLPELEQADKERVNAAMRYFFRLQPEATQAIVDALDVPARSKDASRSREAWRVLMFVNLITGMNHPHEVPWGPTRAGLRTRLSVVASKSDRPPYKAFAGEPIKLKLELKNFGDEPVEYDAQQAAVNQPLIVFDDERRPVKSIGPQVSTAGNKQTIKPGETHALVEQLDLTALYDLKQPGMYYIQWTQGSRSIAPDDAKTPFVPNSNVLAMEIQKAEGNGDEPAAKERDLRSNPAAGSGDPRRAPFVAELPAGLKVELVGITKNTRPATEGWRPDGQAIGDVGHWPATMVLHDKNSATSYAENEPHPEPDADAIDLLVRFERLKAEPSIVFDLPGSMSGFANRPLQEPHRLRVATRLRDESKTPDAQLDRPADEVRIGLTDEPWGTWQQISATGEVLNPLGERDRYRSSYSLIQIQGAGLTQNVPPRAVLVFHQPRRHSHLYAFQIRGIDTDGKEHRVSEKRNRYIDNTELEETEWGVSNSFPADKKLARFEYRLRPYRHWVTFENVSLQPGKTSDVKVKTESLPIPDTEPKPSAERGTSGAGRGSPDPDPALDPTAGLPNSDEETNPTNNANGDLRSNSAAGSGDPRRAQVDNTKGDPQTNQLEKAVTYKCRVVTAKTNAPIAGATVVFKRMLVGDPRYPNEQEHLVEKTTHVTDAEGWYDVTIPPEQLAERYLYIELDVSHAQHAARNGHGYAMSMIRKNEKAGGRPFFQTVAMTPGKAVTGTVVTPEGKPAANVRIKARGPYRYPRDWTQTDKEGRFHMVLKADGSDEFWLMPDDFSPSHHVVDQQRSDMGTLKLAHGIRQSGRLLDSNGQPVAGLLVNVEQVVRKTPDAEPVSFPGYERDAVTDAEGRFTLAPVNPGDYALQISTNHRSPEAPPKFDGVFLGLTLTIDADTKSLELRAVPAVEIRVRNVDSSGAPKRGFEFSVVGRVGERPFDTVSDRPTDGRCMARVPHGLSDVYLGFHDNEHGSVRVRRKPGAPFENIDELKLTVVEADVEGIEVAWYTAPIVLVKAVDTNNQPILDFKPEIKYAPGRSPDDRVRQRTGGVSGHVDFEHQEDGRWRSQQLLPDEDLTVTVIKEGWKSEPQKLRMAEGTERELVFVLKEVAAKQKSDGGQSKSENNANRDLRSKPASGSGDPRRAQELHYSETTEIVLSMNSLKFMLDLDSGLTMDPPQKDRPEQKKMDVYPLAAPPNEVPAGLLGRSLRGVRTKPDGWYLSVSELQQELASDRVKALTKLPYDSDEKATYVFRTADGTDGILQLLAQTDEPKGIRLRFKTFAASKLKTRIKVGMTFDELIALKGRHYRLSHGMREGNLILVYDDIAVSVDQLPSAKGGGKVTGFEPGLPKEVVNNIPYADADTSPPKGLEFLKPYPKLQGLSLDMTEPQFLEIVKQQELKTTKTVEGEKVTHHIALGDGHSLIVMFDKDANCCGIQRVRGEDNSGAGRGSPVIRGEILSVGPNRNEVEISVGADDGVKLRMTFQILEKETKDNRNQPPVVKGTIEVIRIERDRATARILQVRQNGNPAKEDVVIPLKESEPRGQRGEIRWVAPEHKTVWINLGAENAIKKGMKFQVHEKETKDNRNQPPVVKGKIEVVRVVDGKTTEARIIEEQVKETLAKGDPIVALIDADRQPSNANGDLRSNPAAGSGDPRPAQRNEAAPAAGAKRSVVETRILEELERPTSLTIELLNLSDIVALVAKQHRLPIVIDVAALSELNVRQDILLSRTMKDVKLRHALKTILETFSGKRLALVVEDNVLKITADKSPEAAAAIKRMNQRIEAELRKTTDIAFTETPLSDVIQYLSDYYDISIQLHPSVQAAAETPITATMNASELADALALILHEAKLNSCIDHGVLLIATPEEIRQRGGPIPRGFAADLAKLEKADASVRWSALLRGVVEESDSAAIPQLTGLLGNDDLVVQRWTARALVPFGNKARAAQPGLEKLTRSKEGRVAVAAWQALIEIGREDFSTLPLLLSALDREDETLMNHWMALIWRYDPKVWHELTAKYPTLSIPARRTLASSKFAEVSDGRAFVVLALSDPDLETRRCALRRPSLDASHLTVSQREEFETVLVTRLKDLDAESRVLAAGQLLKLNQSVDAAITTILAEASHGPGRDVLRRCVKETHFLFLNDQEQFDEPCRSNSEATRNAARQTLAIICRHYQTTLNYETTRTDPFLIWGSNRDGWCTRLSPLTEKPQVGEPIKLKLELHNLNTTRPAKVTFSQPARSSLVVIGPDGREMSPINRERKTSETTVTVETHDPVVLIEELDLAAEYPIKQPGTYLVQWTQDRPGVKSDDGQSLTPNSNVLTVEVAEP